ncbi:MAG: DMT family transporter [Clostridia bacterium]|nr:DMT family transporter [Clostridia bacterium]
MTSRSLYLRSVLALVLVTVIWGSGFIATEYAIASQMDASLIMALRFLLGAVCVGAFCYKQIAKCDKACIFHGCMAGVILFGAFYTQTLGQSATTVSNAAFITASNVVMIPLIEWALYRRRPGAKVLAMCLVAMGGILLLTVDFTSGLAFGAGDLLVLLCAFLFAMQIVYVGRTCNDHDPLMITFWQLLAAGAAGTVVFLLIRPEVTAAHIQHGILPVAYLAVFSTCVCYALQTWAQKNVPPAPAGVILSMEGLFGTLFSLLLGLEAFRWSIAAGGALIMIAVVVMNVSDAKKES